MAWVRWGAVNYAILLALLVAGAILLVPAGLAGWGTDDERIGSYVLPAISFPFTGLAYLAALAVAARRSRRPRWWAIGLTPVFWAAVPIFALGVAAAGIAALWLVLLTFGAIVKLPPGPTRA
jgi:hypothetical protein